MGIFSFFKNNNDKSTQSANDTYKSDSLRKEIIKLINEVEELEIFKKSENIKNSFVKDFTNEFLENLKSQLDPNYNKNSPWVLEPGTLFQKYNSKDTFEILNTIEPVRNLIKSHLQSIVSDYEDFIKDVTKHRNSISQYLEAKRSGEYLRQNRNFLRTWLKEIGPQWYGLGHFLCEYDDEKENLSFMEKDRSQNDTINNDAKAMKIVGNFVSPKLPEILELQLRNLLTEKIKDNPLLDSPMGGIYILEIVSIWKKEMKRSNLENIFGIDEEKISLTIDQVSKKVLDELVEL